MLDVSNAEVEGMMAIVCLAQCRIEAKGYQVPKARQVPSATLYTQNPIP